MVQGKNTLGYLRTRTFYTPERKYAYKYASITKCLTYSPRAHMTTFITYHTVKQLPNTTIITYHTVKQSHMTIFITYHTVKQLPKTTVITYHTVKESHDYIYYLPLN
jgi:hypothetical protein